MRSEKTTEDYRGLQRMKWRRVSIPQHVGATRLFAVADNEQGRLRSPYLTDYLEAPSDRRFGAFTRLAAHLYNAPCLRFL